MKNALRVTLAVLLCICFCLPLSPAARAGSTVYKTLSVGSTATLYASSSYGSVYSYGWYTTNPSAVQIVGGNTSSMCTIKVVSYFSSDVVVRCDMYYTDTYGKVGSDYYDCIVRISGGGGSSDSGGSYTISAPAYVDIDLAYTEPIEITCGVSFSDSVYLEYSNKQGSAGYNIEYPGGKKAYLYIFPDGKTSGSCELELIQEKSSSLSVIKDRVTIRYTTTCSHRYGSGTVTVEPTYTSTGKKVYTCRSCGATKTETIPQLTAPAEYTITYNANGGENAPASQTKTEGTALTLSSAVPTRSASAAGSYTVTLNANGGAVSPSALSAARTTKYTFRSWNTAADGSGASYAPGASYTAEGNATLYARWDANTVTAPVSLPVPTRSDYEFKGWATSSSASAGMTGSYTPEGNVTLYAVWEAKLPPPPEEYTIAYNANGGENAPASQTKTEGTALTLSSAVPTRSDSAAGSYMVTLNANGGAVSPSALSAARTTKYTFRSWNTASDGSGASYAPGASYTAEGNATLYARWDANTVTAPVSLPVPTRSDYEFKGWATSSSASAGVTGSYTPEGNVTLYAVWEAKLPPPPEEYTIAYNANGGENAPASQTKIEGTALTLSSAVPTRSDSAAGSYTVTLNANGGAVSPSALSAARTTKYTFRSWNTSPNGSGASYAPGASYTAEGNATLYARWDANTVTAPVTLPVPTRSDYEFKGWATSSSASAGMTGSYTPEGNVTLYAVWGYAGISESWGEVEWTLNTDGVLTISGDGAIGEFGSESASAWREHADSIRVINIEQGVSEIGANAFRGCSAVTSVTIPDSVTVIGRSAFYDCAGLTDVNLSYGLESIGDWVFRGCENLESIVIPDSVKRIGEQAFCLCTSLTDVSIPEGITGIGSYAFNYCESLRNAAIPDSVTDLGDGVFFGCISLESATLPEGLTGIGEDFFYDCISLESISIPDSVTSIGSWAFRGCESLTEIEIPANVTRIGDRAFCLCTGLEYVTIPDGVTSIEDVAFYGCSSLTGVTIPGSVTRIGDSAFSGCDMLEDLTLPYGVKTIGSYAFNECDSLESLVFPDSVTTVGDCAFYGCSNLESVTIPTAMTEIGIGAFYGCRDLKDVYYDGTEAEWNAINIEGANEYLTSAEIHCAVPTPTATPTPTPTPLPSPILTPVPIPVPTPNPNAVLRVPAGVEVIEAEAFTGTSAEEIYIPAGVKEIGSKAFSECLRLKVIHFADGNIAVAEDFLSGCFNTLIIDAPAGSIVAQNEEEYRIHLCAPAPPPVGIYDYATVTGRTEEEKYIPVYADADLTQLLGYIEAGTVVIFDDDADDFLFQSFSYAIRLSEYDDIMYVAPDYVSYW